MKKFYFSIFVSIMLLITIFSTTLSVNAKSTTSEVASSGVTEYYALLIGTDPDTYCDNDADDMYDALLDNGWKSENVEKLVSIQASRENFIDEITWLDEKEDRNDVVLFFFSGHGGSRCIAFFDEWSGTFNTDVMALINLNLYFNRLEANKLILIFDTCHAGSLQKKKDPMMRSSSNQILSENINSMKTSFEEEDDIVGIFGLSGFGRIVIASCGRFEYSYGAPEYQNGYFTYHYVEGLKGSADSNNNGRVSVEEAFNYAEPRTIEDTKNNPKTETQHPKMTDRISGQVDITNMEESSRHTESNLERLIIVLRERFAILLEKIRQLL
ncbi:MAG: caspase family protein [Thermoplasmatales archaeon]|nr:caspase family protein [Thermoplasmatales archaeon]